MGRAASPGQRHRDSAGRGEVEQHHEDGPCRTVAADRWRTCGREPPRRGAACRPGWPLVAFRHVPGLHSRSAENEFGWIFRAWPHQNTRRRGMRRQRRCAAATPSCRDPSARPAARVLTECSVRLAERIRDEGDVCSTGYWYADPDPADATKLVAQRRKLLPPPRLGDLLAGYQPVNDGAMMRTEVARWSRGTPRARSS
jgi:hypothetical protein